MSEGTIKTDAPREPAHGVSSNPASSEPTLGDVLAISLLFDAGGRAAFERALRGRVLVAAPLEELPIVDLSSRRAVPEVLVATLNGGREHLRSAGSKTLGELVPGALLAPDGPVVLDAGSTWLRTVLERAGWTRWSVLLDQHLSAFADVANVGTKTLAKLVGTCFERGLEAVVEAWASDHHAGDLAVVLRHERAGAAQPLADALLEQWSGDGPLAAREAAGRLLAESVSSLLNPEPALQVVLNAGGDERSSTLFVRLSLARAGRPTLDEVAAEMAISTSRLRDLRDTAGARVRAALSLSPPSLRWLVSALRRRLGAVTTEATAGVALERMGVTERSSADLALWLAGPYLPVRNCASWLAVDPTVVLNRTLASVAADGGVRRLVDVTSELDDLEIANDQLAPWLSACGAIVVHDAVARVTGPLADAVERVLDGSGAARTIEELVADLKRGKRTVDPTELEAVLRGPRFCVTTTGAVGLAAWDTDPVVLPPSRPAAAPRPAPLRGTHEVSTSAARQDRQWLSVRVDTEVLHGCEGVVPIELAEGLGLVPLARRTFSGRWGPVTLAYEGTQPTRGSVRPVVLAAGARANDTLLLGFSAAGDVTVEVRCGGADTIPTDADLTTTRFLEHSTLTGGPQ